MSANETIDHPCGRRFDSGTMGIMKTLVWRQAATLLTACAWVLGVTSLLGLLRLLPWLFHPEVPWTVIAPFASAVGAKATETTLLVGLPVGAALAAARLSREQIPFSLRLLILPTVLMGVAVAVGSSWTVNSSQPGRVAIGLLERSRASCAHAPRPRAAVVPMVGMSWLCFPGNPPRIVGALPGSNGQVWFSASRIEAAPDLSGFTLDDFQLSGDSSPWLRAANLHVGRARVTGLPPWGRPAKLSVAVRSALLAVSAWIIAAAVTVGQVRWRLGHVVAALLMGAGPALLVAAAVERLDASSADPGNYGWLPLLAGVSVAVSLLAARALSRWRFARASAG